MKTIYNKTIIAAMALLSAVSCQIAAELADVQEETSGRIELKSLVAPMAGEQQTIRNAGLFITYPVNIDNVRLDIDASGAVTPEQDLFWGKGQKEESNFYAYSPYDPDCTSAFVLNFTINEDQTTLEGLNASDLLVASASAKPSDGAVSLEFHHLFSQLNIYFDNRSEKEIVGVKAVGIANNLRATLKYNAVTKAEGNADIKAYKDETLGCYRMILPPIHYSNLKLQIAMSDGTVKEYEAGELTLESDKYYDNASSPIILLKDEVKQIKLNFTVSDWDDGGQLNYNKGEEEGGYDSLADLASTATSTESAFKARVKNMVVTYVYPSGYKAFAQDLTGGMTIYCKCSSLYGSYTGWINGRIMLYQGYAELTALDVSSAEQNFDVVIPEKELTLEELENNYNRYIGCRIRLSGIQVTKGFTTGTSAKRTGEIYQGGRAMQIYNDSNAAFATEGFEGELIAYPALYNGVRQLLVCESDWFVGQEVPVANFQDNTIPGFYVLSSGKYNPVMTLSVNDQVCVGMRSSYMNFSVMNPVDGYSVLCRLEATGLQVGNSVQVTVSTLGTSAIPTGTFKYDVVKAEGSQYWLLSADMNTGFILNL